MPLPSRACSLVRSWARATLKWTSTCLAFGTDTILLVEDDDIIRALIERYLKSTNYQVLAASNGHDALAQWQQHVGAIRLLITDVVMPGMSGRELAKKLVTLDGETKVLYMSGYADDVIRDQGVLENGSQFLAKPFGMEELGQKVYELLNS